MSGKRGPYRPYRRAITLGVTDEDRFWADVDKTGDCWVRTAGIHPWTGYSHFWVPDLKRRVPAHRWAWEWANGQAIPDGLLVRHHCDNPPCVRPEHLAVGTHADNARDMAERGRAAHNTGPACGRSKLTSQQVADIRQRAVGGRGGNITRLAEACGVDPSTVRRIVRGQSWGAV